MSFIVMIGLALAGAYAIQSLVEYFCGTPMEKLSILVPKLHWLDDWSWLLIYLAAVFGVVFSYHYSVDLFAELSGQVTSLGKIMTGAGIGMGAGWVRDFYSKYLKRENNAIPG